MLMAFKLVEDHFDELELRLKVLSKAKVSYGMFDNSQHGDSSWTQVSLFRYLNTGNTKMGLVPRPVLDMSWQFNRISSSPLKKDLKVFLSNINKKKTQKDMDKVLHGVGNYYRDALADLFGKSPPVAANTKFTQEWKKANGYDPSKPLIMTGELRSNISYRIGETEYKYGNK